MKDKNIKTKTTADENIIDDIVFEKSDEEVETSHKEDKLKKLRNDLKNCRKEKEEYLTGWQRAKADYVNLQKELEKVRISSSFLAKESMAANLLPVIDSFDMAFANKTAWNKVDKEWRTGIEYIYQQFITSLSLSGIEKISEVGILFNPEVHHSIKIIDTDDKSKNNTIAEIVQVGYKIGHKVIRPAIVNIYEYKE